MNLAPHGNLLPHEEEKLERWLSCAWIDDVLRYTMCDCYSILDFCEGRMNVVWIEILIFYFFYFLVINCAALIKTAQSTVFRLSSNRDFYLKCC